MFWWSKLKKMQNFIISLALHLYNLFRAYFELILFIENRNSFFCGKSYFFHLKLIKNVSSIIIIIIFI